MTYTFTTPHITLLNTCPPPQVIKVPHKPGGNYFIETARGSEKIKLSPPQTKAADFYVTMQHYDVEDGLGLNIVKSSFCDKDGNLWFGTLGGGVSRYNGKSFSNFTTAQGLPDNQVFSIYQDKSENMWFGTLHGISKYDGKSFKNYSTENGITGPLYSCIMQDKNLNIWFGTGNGVSRFDGKSFKSYTVSDGLVDNFIYCMLQDKNGNIWFGTQNGVSVYDGKSFRNFTTSQGLINNVTLGILEDDERNIWLATEKGVSKYNGKFFQNFTTAQGLVNNNVSSLLQDKNRHLWFGTREGVSEYDGKSFKNYTIANGLASNEILSMVKDKNENIWFSTSDVGIFRFPGNSLTSYKVAQGLPDNKIWAICQQTNGILWFGSVNGGAVRYDGKSFTSFTTEQGLAGNTITCIYEDKKGNIWFATGDGVSCYNEKSFTNYTIAQGLGTNIATIAEDKKGNMWFGGIRGGGISKLNYDRTSFTKYISIKENTNNNVHKLFIDTKGNLWFGNALGGVTLYDGKSCINYNEKQGLANSTVLDIFEDKNNNLWVATLGGVSRFDGKTFVNFNGGQGLPHEVITSIAENKRGEIWLGTFKGFCELKFKCKDPSIVKTYGESYINSDISFSNEILQAKYEPVFETYNFKNGYPVTDVVAMCVDTANVLWAATVDKLVRFDYSAIYKDPKPPKVFIQDVKINSENICWNDLRNNEEKKDGRSIPPNIVEEITSFGKTLDDVQREDMSKKYTDVSFDSIATFYPVPINLVLPYSHNEITFDFAAIETSRPALVLYQYIFDGYDKNWNPVTDKSTASFGNIHEGNYIFKLKARNPDGVWSEPLAYSFKVLPPWYRSWWAYSLYAVTFLIAVWSFITWRIGILKKEKVLLEEKIALRTLELKEEKEKVELTLSELKSTQLQLIQSKKAELKQRDAELKQLKAEFERQITETEMAALRAQMNPHFIFNVLNSINKFILNSDKRAASDYLVQFSRLIRLTLENSKADRVPLQKDLEALRIYICMEKLRFGDQFNFAIEVNEKIDLQYTQIPPLLIQPYVENAIWHGLMQKDDPGYLSVKVTEPEDSIIKVEILDNGIGRKLSRELKSKSATVHKSYGMQITSDRIKIVNNLYNINATVEIEDLYDRDKRPGGTKVTLLMPV